MNKTVKLLLITFPLVSVLGAPLIPTTPGMSWTYNMTQEVGEGIRLADSKPDADGKIRGVVTYRLDGIQKVDGKDLLKFEMHRDGVVTNTDLVTVGDRGIDCAARINLDGEIVKLDPPQTMVAAPLKAGTTWDFDGKAGDLKARQHYNVIGEEDVAVPAGKFRAFHIHGDQTTPTAVTIDRWFANGTGIVKDVTATKSVDGDLLMSVTLELKDKPAVTNRPEVKPAPVPRKLFVTVTKEPLGQAVSRFAPDSPKIYARWQGHGLPNQAKIRVVWIAENIGEVAPPDYTIDEATTAATAPDSHGLFTLSRPDDGWAPGDYRVEFYLDDALADTVKLKISK